MAEKSMFDSRQKNDIFLFSTAYRQGLGPSQLRVPWVPGALSPGLKRPGSRAYSYTSTSLHIFVTWCFFKQGFTWHLHHVKLSSTDSKWTALESYLSHRSETRAASNATHIPSTPAISEPLQEGSDINVCIYNAVRYAFPFQFCMWNKETRQHATALLASFTTWRLFTHANTVHSQRCC
jgi:hypothetical protein